MHSVTAQSDNRRPAKRGGPNPARYRKVAFTYVHGGTAGDDYGVGSARESHGFAEGRIDQFGVAPQVSGRGVRRRPHAAQTLVQPGYVWWRGHHFLRVDVGLVNACLRDGDGARSLHVVEGNAVRFFL